MARIRFGIDADLAPMLRALAVLGDDLEPIKRATLRIAETKAGAAVRAGRADARPLSRAVAASVIAPKPGVRVTAREIRTSVSLGAARTVPVSGRPKGSEVFPGSEWGGRGTIKAGRGARREVGRKRATWQFRPHRPAGYYAFPGMAQVDATGMWLEALEQIILRYGRV